MDLDPALLLNYGGGYALLFVVLFWLRPYVARFFESHFALMRVLTEHLPLQTEHLKAIREEGCGRTLRVYDPDQGNGHANAMAHPAVLCAKPGPEGAA